jgi:hypothetical protein
LLYFKWGVSCGYHIIHNFLNFTDELSICNWIRHFRYGQQFFSFWKMDAIKKWSILDHWPYEEENSSVVRIKILVCYCTFSFWNFNLMCINNMYLALKIWMRIVQVIVKLIALSLLFEWSIHVLLEFLFFNKRQKHIFKYNLKKKRNLKTKMGTMYAIIHNKNQRHK